jgi:hypothetical protein
MPWIIEKWIIAVSDIEATRKASESDIPDISR